jgi:AraC family transcriptional regulator of arabinose operon
MDNFAQVMYYRAMEDGHRISLTHQASLSILLADHYSEPPGYRIQRHNGLKDWFMTFTHAGQGRYLWNDKEYVCSRGDLVVLPPGLSQDYGTASTDQNWEHYWVHFNPQPLWLRWLMMPETQLEPYICHISNSVSETRLIYDFERLLSNYRAANHVAAEFEFEDILLTTIQEYAEMICRGVDKRIADIILYSYQNFTNDITLPALAKQVSMSPSRLAHLFKAQTNRSIIQMLLELRLYYAMRLLRFTPLSIGEISLKAGFQSQFYFSRRFKMFFGNCPKVYRKQLSSLRI